MGLGARGVFSVKALIDNGLHLCGRKVRVNGTVKNLRKQKQLYFIGLNDGTSQKNLQVVVPTDILEDSIQSGDVLSIFGELVLSHRIQQQIELKADSIPMNSPCDRSYPLINSSKMPLDQIRKFAHLQSRTNYFRDMLLLRSSSEFAFHDFYRRKGFVKVHTPVLTTEDCEGAGEMFNVTTGQNRDDNAEKKKSFFDRPVHLTVSGQLHLESLVNGLGNVYTFGPAFRAENSRTIRHLSEFYMIEAELGFVNNLSEVMDNAEECIKFSIESLLDSSHQILKQLWLKAESPMTFLDLKSIVESPFVRIPFEEAIKILNTDMNCKLSMNDQLLREHELFLTERKFNSPVFVYDYPKQQKAFYARENEDEATCASFDLLVPRVSELAGGGLREERLQKLEDKLRESHKVNAWYLDLRKYGSIPHGGYGIGFERFILWITDSANIRNTIPFTRYVNSCQM